MTTCAPPPPRAINHFSLNRYMELLRCCFGATDSDCGRWVTVGDCGRWYSDAAAFFVIIVAIVIIAFFSPWLCLSLPFCHCFLSVPPLLPLSLLFVIVINIALSLLCQCYLRLCRCHSVITAASFFLSFVISSSLLSMPLRCRYCFVSLLSLSLPSHCVNHQVFLWNQKTKTKNSVSVAETFHFFRFRVFGFTKLLFSNPVTQFHCFILSVVDYYCCCFYEE